MLAKTGTPTTRQIRWLISKILADTFGGDVEHWSRLVGNVAALTRSTVPHSNWAVRARGTEDECDLINRAVAIVREVYPYVER